MQWNNLASFNIGGTEFPGLLRSVRIDDLIPPRSAAGRALGDEPLSRGAGLLTPLVDATLVLEPGDPGLNAMRQHLRDHDARQLQLAKEFRARQKELRRKLDYWQARLGKLSKRVRRLRIEDDVLDTSNDVLCSKWRFCNARCRELMEERYFLNIEECEAARQGLLPSIVVMTMTGKDIRDSRCNEWELHVDLPFSVLADALGRNDYSL